MIEITDASLKQCIKSKQYTVLKTRDNAYSVVLTATGLLDSMQVDNVQVATICTVSEHDIKVDFVNLQQAGNIEVRCIGVFKHSIIASALVDYLDPTTRKEVK
jgi:ribonucleotide reductase beta subunit family protein with ferritin-like domain